MRCVVLGVLGDEVAPFVGNLVLGEAGPVTYSPGSATPSSPQTRPPSLLISPRDASNGTSATGAPRYPIERNTSSQSRSSNVPVPRVRPLTSSLRSSRTPRTRPSSRDHNRPRPQSLAL